MNPLRFSRNRGGINTSVIGVVLLCVTTIGSLAIVLKNVNSINHPTHTAVTICHWQLEAGYRDAMQAVIEDYEKLHPDVEITQVPITEKVYTQWINTQLISKTAPDLVEMGHSNLNTKDEYVVRFFDSIGDEVVKPNPYNKGTPLDGVAWKETFIDGMRGGFKDNLQDYYMVPTTSYNMRLYCNMNLIKEVTGKVDPPKSFGELIDICQKVRAYSLASTGGRVIPLVSCYGSDAVTSPYLVPFTAKFESAVDVDLDGINTASETFFALTTGKVSLQTPAIRGYWEAMKLLCDQMQTGFSSMDRQQAQFQFVNGNAAFLSTGSWDARGTFLAADQKNIQIKLIEWPLPKPGEQFSEFIAGKANEAAARGGGAYGMFKYSTHKAVALDFLKFLSSVAENEKLNRIADWPPITIGSQPSDIMKPFMPDPVGYTSSINLRVGTRMQSVLNSESVQYLQGEHTIDQFFAAYNKALFDPKSGGNWAVWKEFDQRWRDCRNQELVLDRDSLNALMSPGDFSAKRYQRTILQQLRRNNGRDYQYLFQKYVGKPLPEF